MSQPVNNFKIGLFTLAGLALLLLGLVAFGLRSYLRPVTMYETYIPGDVAGLTVGSAVELRGVAVGKVSRIAFSWIEYKPTYPTYVVVQFDMRNDISPGSISGAQNALLEDAIRRGLRARIKGRGVTGTSILSIEFVNPDANPPITVPWTPTYTYIPSAPGQLMEIFDAADKVLHNLQNLDLAGINQHVQYDLKSAGNLLDKAGQIDFNALGTNLTGLLTEVRGSNTRLKALLSDTDDTVKHAQLEKLSADLDALTGQLQDAVGRLEPGVANVDFDALNQTILNAQQTLRDLDDAVTTLKRYPSGFILGKPPTPVKQVEPSGKP